MDWLKGMFSKQKKEAYQFYNTYDQHTLNQLNMARSNPEQVIGYQSTTDRTKSNNEILLEKKSKDYIEIKELKKGQNMLIRKIQKSNYDELIYSYHNKAEKWTDPDMVQQIKGKTFRWARITQILPNATFMSKDIEICPKMVLQGNLNNCYFLSAVAAIAQRPYRIKNLFTSLENNANGIYMCKVTFNGIYQEVVLDDYFPVDQNNNLINAKAYNNTEFWPLLLEKAWAKLFGGYDIVNWGYNTQSLYALTGAPGLHFYMKYIEQDSNISKRMFKEMLIADKGDCLITAGFAKDKNIQWKYELQTGHAYTILSVYEVTVKDEKKRFLQLRNPYGANLAKPSFKYSVNDKFWQQVSAQQKKRINFDLVQNPSEGIFYMEWSLYETLSSTTSISLINDNANYIYEVLPFKNNIPRYLSIKIESISTFYLLIAQKNQYRMVAKNETKYATIIVLVSKMDTNIKGNRRYEYVSSSYYFNQTETNYFSVPIENKVPNSRYTVRIYMYSIEGETTDITLGYYSEDNFGVKLLEGVDDDEFVNRTLLAKANDLPVQSSKKKDILNIPGAWCVIQTILQSNIGYIAYHIPPQNPPKRYKITIDETKNYELLFVGTHRNTKAFQSLIESGQQTIFVYTYSSYLYNPFIDSEIEDTRELPKPTIS